MINKIVEFVIITIIKKNPQHHHFLIFFTMFLILIRISKIKRMIQIK